MEWASVSAVLTFLLSGNGLVIWVTKGVAFSLPILMYVVLYRPAFAEGHHDFLLLVTSGSEKTAYCTLLERKSTRAPKSNARTHTSQTPSFVAATLPPSIPIGSNAFRSVNDPTLAERKKSQVKYRVRDTPGHGKLRDSQGMLQLTSMADPKSKKGVARGVIFMVDAGTIMNETELRDAAGYLHDVLLILQKRLAKSKTSVFRKLQDIPVLVAANKQDLFTALPANSVKERLEAEIEKIRQSKRKGVLDADVSVGDDEQDVLGGDEGRQKFTFKLLEEDAGVKVTVVGGAVRPNDEADAGAGVRQWEEWIGSCL
ncbi:hypothetical protein CISG_08138 [Coccidioides immitis RMSCC 3703]|uniref:Signal recognition particle receptor subunit beta n=1 Tax=Coccidioides immitis RMSCC 3703 TaxID=454286 RepID=A0A0J8R896_COCIT|nr:hypothetical protein CISG_08138 [Coccidioides immitis RMSCC 3703]